MHEHSTVTSFTTQTLAECFPIGALRDSWYWRDLSTGEPLLVPLEEREIHAQRARDLNRAHRLDPPIRKETNMVSFAAKVLNLTSLPRGSGVTMRNYSMNITEQWVTTPPRKPPLQRPGPTSLHTRCEHPRIDGRMTPMTTSSAFARVLCPTNAVPSATNNSKSTKSLPISSDDFSPSSPSLFYLQKAIDFVSEIGIPQNWRHSQPSAFPQTRRRPSLLSNWPFQDHS